MTKKDKYLYRYICTYYKALSKDAVSKENKYVKVLEAYTGFEAEFKLYSVKKATFIKSIRNIEELQERFYLYDDDLFRIEQHNNLFGYDNKRGVCEQS